MAKSAPRKRAKKVTLGPGSPSKTRPKRLTREQTPMKSKEPGHMSIKYNKKLKLRENVGKEKDEEDLDESLPDLDIRRDRARSPSPQINPSQVAKDDNRSDELHLTMELDDDDDDDYAEDDAEGASNWNEGFNANLGDVNRIAQDMASISVHDAWQVGDTCEECLVRTTIKSVTGCVSHIADIQSRCLKEIRFLCNKILQVKKD